MSAILLRTFLHSSSPSRKNADILFRARFANPLSSSVCQEKTPFSYGHVCVHRACERSKIAVLLWTSFVSIEPMSEKESRDVFTDISGSISLRQEETAPLCYWHVLQNRHFVSDVSVSVEIANYISKTKNRPFVTDISVSLEHMPK